MLFYVILLLLIFTKIILLFIFYFFHENYFYFFMFRNVPGSINARYRIIRVSKSPPEKIQHPENNA